MVSIHKVLHKALHKARHKNQKFIIQNRKMKQITIKKTPGNLTISEFEECDEATQQLKTVVVIVGVALVKKLTLLFEAGKKQKI